MIRMAAGSGRGDDEDGSGTGRYRPDKGARMRAMELPVVLTPGEDGWIVAECPVIPGCISQGRTREEALANIREAILLCLETREAEGWELPQDYEVARVATG